MAIVYGEFKPDGDTESYILGGANNKGYFFSFHDIYSGNVIMAKNLGEKGAEVYRFENIGHDTQAAISKIGPLLLPKNVYVQLLPWFKTEPFPVRMDDGHPGELTISHDPQIKMALVRSIG